MIHNIIHISDIHIRTGDSKKSRYNEYVDVFNNLYDSIATQPSIIEGSAIIIITGDVFHDKNRIGPSGIKTAVYLLQKLSNLADVIVIRGNHDYRQDHPTEPDMISALLSYEIPNVTYLDTAGLHMHKNVCIGLVPIQDTLLYGSTSGITASLPPFPNPSTSASREAAGAKYKIALFHGTITGCTLQNGTVHTRDGYPIGWFQGYDAILLGDIHLQQVNRANVLQDTHACESYKFSDETPWGYPGSLIQQNFGEPIKDHGYILWDLQKSLIHRYHIKNPYGMIKIVYTGDMNSTYIVYNTPIVFGSKKDSLPDWLPDFLHIRVQGEGVNNEVLRVITEKLQEHGKVVLSITKKDLHISQNITSASSIEAAAAEIVNINSTETLIDYIEKVISTQNKFFGNKWKSWLVHPESLLIPTSCIPPSLLDRIGKKSAKIEEASAKYLAEFEKVKNLQIINGEVKLNKLEWNWILNYGDKNVFDFDANYKNINVLNARNGEGKSNFLEIICISLFGDGFPSRYNTNYSANIICDKKPPGVYASTIIYFTLNREKYMLERSLRSNTNKKSIKFDIVKLSQEINGKHTVIKQNTVAVNDWICENIGAIDAYLMSSMLSQNADKDFFSMNVKTQKELLDRVLSLNHITSLQSLLNESVKYYKDVIEIVDTYIDGVKSQVHEVDPKHVDNLTFLRESLETITLDVDQLWKGWNMISEKRLMEISNIDEYILDLSSKETELATLSSQIGAAKDRSANVFAKQIFEKDKEIEEVCSELDRFKMFQNDEATEKSEAANNKSRIQELENKLKIHPCYNKNNIHRDIQEIKRSKSLEDVKEYDTHKVASAEGAAREAGTRELLRKIQEFESWKSVSEERFSSSINFTEDISKAESRLDILKHENINRPDTISEYNNNLTILYNSKNLLKKNKEDITDKRPNKPSKTTQWLTETEAYLQDFDFKKTVDGLEHIRVCIEKIPVLCQNILGVSEKITDHEKYIKECLNIAFNPDCDACNVQPWRVVYNKCFLELPGLKDTRDRMLKELEGLTFCEIKKSIDYTSYERYCKLLKSLADEKSKNIEKHNLFVKEKKMWSNWDDWNIEYENVKNKYDAVVDEINKIEAIKKKVENDMTSCLSEIDKISRDLQTLRVNSEQHAIYLENLIIRKEEADKCREMLNANWYKTLYLYKTEINIYLRWLRESFTRLETEKKEAVLLFENIKRFDELGVLVEKNRKISKAYPLWVDWKNKVIQEKDMRIQVKELEGIVGINSVNASNLNSLIELSELVEEIKKDFILLSCLCESFKGYKEWLYREHVGKLIQKKVNDVLEYICDERPLFLEYDWLDKTEALSWFIRDGTSRPVIEKASGFQRFIVGVAMRVSINQIGLNRVCFKEFFIDEGFTACDVDNLEKVPDFLRGLLQFYDNIYLATHLEDLKLFADVQMYIAHKNGLSQIQYHK